jgi:hypothetical protein
MRYVVDSGIGLALALSFAGFFVLCWYTGVPWLLVPIAAAHLAAVYLLITRWHRDEVLFLSASVGLALVMLVTFAIAASHILATS